MSDVFNLQGRVNVSVSEATAHLLELDATAIKAHHSLLALQNISIGAKGTGAANSAREATQAQTQVAVAGAKARERELSTIEKQARADRAKMERTIFQETERTRRTMDQESLRQTGVTERARLAEIQKAGHQAQSEQTKAARDVQRVQEQAQKDATKAVETAKKQQEKLERDAQKVAEKAGENAQNAVEKAQRDTTKALDKQLKEQQKLQKQAQQEAERAQKTAQNDARKAQQTALREKEADFKTFDRQMESLWKKQAKDEENAAKAGLKAAQTARDDAAKDLKKRTETRKAARSDLADGASNAASLTGAGILGVLGLASKEAMDFEQAFAAVRETVAGTDAQLDQLAHGLRKMSLELPNSAEDLSQIAADAGQLGISGTKNVLAFTKVIAQLSTVTKISTDEAGRELAKFAVAAVMPQKDFDRLGSTIARLKNIGASTVQQMLDMGQRIAGAGHMVGMSAPQIMAVSNALTSMGINAESGGTSFSRTLQMIAVASATSRKEAEGFLKGMGESPKAIDALLTKGAAHLTAFAKTAGMSVEEFKTLFAHDATGAVTKFIEGLSKLKDGQQFLALDAAGIKSSRMVDTLARATNAVSVLHQSLREGDKAWQDNNALQTLSDKRLNSTANQLALTKNEVQELARSFGERMLPAERDALKALNGLLSGFNNLSEGTRDTVVKLAAFGGLALLVGGRVVSLVKFIHTCREAFGGLGAAQALAARNAQIAAANEAALAETLGAEGAAATGAAAATTAAGESAVAAAAGTVAFGAAFVTLAALAVIATAAVGGYLINQQAVIEHNARLTAANANLEASNKSVALSFGVLKRAATVDAGAGKTVSDLAAQYEKLKGSAAGLDKFKNIALPQARHEIAVNVHLTMPQRAELNHDLDQVARQINTNLGARQFQVTAKAQADQGALANLRKAFYNTFGWLYDEWKATFITPFWTAGKWAFGQIAYVAKTSWDGIASGMHALRVGLADAWYSLTGGFNSGFNKMLRGLSDAVTGFVGWVVKKVGGAAQNLWNWYNGRTANHGETDANAPSLPAGPAPVAGAPKSNIWRQAHGLPSYDVGTNYVPVDQIAQVHKGEIIIPAADAEKVRGRRFDLQNQLGALTSKIDARALGNAQAGNNHRDPELKVWRAEASQLRHELAQVKREGADAAREEKERAKQAKTERKAALADQKRDLKDAAKDVKETAKEYEDASKRIQSATEKQLEKLKTEREGFAGLFTDAQKKLIELGDTSNPLGQMVENLSRLLNLNGKAHDVAAHGRSEIERLNIAASRAHDREDALKEQASNLGAGTGGNGSGDTGGDDSAPTSTVSKRAARSLFEKFNLASTVDMTCADVASKTIAALGFHLKREVGAGRLEAEVQSLGWARVDPRTAPLGSAVFKYSKSARSHVHAMMSMGDGELASSSDKQTSYFKARGNERAYAPPGTVGGGALPRLAPVAAPGKGLTPQGAKVLSSMGMSDSDLGVIDEVLRGGANFNLSSVAALGKGWGKPIKSNDKNGLVFDLQSKLAGGEMGPLVGQLAAMISAGRAQGHPLKPREFGPGFAPNSPAGALGAFAGQGIRVSWKKGWSQQDVALDFLRQIVTAEQARVNATQAADDAAKKAKETTAEQIKAVKEARSELKKQNDEAKTQLALLQEQAQWMAAHPGDEDGWTKFVERKKAIGEFTKSDAIQTLLKSGRGGEARLQINDFAGRYDFSKRLSDWMPGSSDAEGGKLIEETLGKAPSLAESAKSAYLKLQSALESTDGSASDLQKVLLSLGQEDDTRTFLGFAQSLQKAGTAADGMRAKYAPVLALLKQADAELLTRAQKEADAPRLAAQSRFKELSDDLDARGRAASTFDPRRKMRDELTAQFQKDNLPFDPAQINKIVNRDYWMTTVESLSSGLENTFHEAFSNISGGFKGMFDTVLGGMKKWLEEMATQMLTSWVMQQVFGGLLGTLGAKGAGTTIGGFAGGGFSLSGGHAAGASLGGNGFGASGQGGGFGLHSAPITFNGSHADGLDRVPFDGYRALLHNGEAVLNAQAAQQWRVQQSQQDRLTASSASSSRTGSGSGGSQDASGDGGRHYHFNAPVTIQAQNTREFERELPVGGGLPKRELRRRGRSALGV